jgi:DNA repair protein RadA/Sms
MAKNKVRTIYSCQNCGAQRSKWEGRCSDCGAWNSFVEEIQAPEGQRGWVSSQTASGPTTIKTMSLDQGPETLNLNRLTTGISEFDRVLGGGLVQGSLVLLGGSPGIGKSTLLLQACHGLADKNGSVLYISAEESVDQTSSRAHRLNIRSKQIQIGSESNLHSVIALAKESRPKVLIVDSIQTVYLPELQAAPGSVSQVRECCGHLMMLAKNEGIAVILVGHVTKEGSIAGPKVLEHMVDCVLAFEGDTSYNYRLLRSLKNRFGPAHELGIFQMSSLGLEEVLNPSELFLEERGESLVGSSIFASVEGSRPLLCEVQALTVPTPLSMPRRTSLGIDTGRLNLLVAVIERHLSVQLYQADIFINVVGGLKILEPAVDLAIAASILSSESRQPLDAKTCYFGEIGLTGEIRGVSFPDLRIKEGLKLGFKNFVVPSSNKKHLNIPEFKEANILYLKDVRDLNKNLSKFL